MASSAAPSRHRVTITLGRSGQVVKRRAISDNGNDEDMPSSGRKRPVKDRIGSNMSGTESHDGQQRNKRRQTEISTSQHGDDDCQVGRNDLRLKLMRKGLSSNGGAEQNGVDLREKLSRKPKNLPRYSAREHVPESRSAYDAREIDARGHVPELRPIYDAREKVPESRSRYDTRERVHEPRAHTLVSQIPPVTVRSVDNLFKSEKPYPSWTDGGLIQRSPDKLRSVRRDSSPTRTYDQMRPMPPLRSVGTSRASGLATRDAPETLRTQPYAGKSTISIDTAHQANGVTPSGTVLSTAHVMTEISLTVPELLESLGLQKYVVIFQAEEVDMAALRQMADSDLKEIGVPMGPRKKILQAVAPYPKQQQR